MQQRFRKSKNGILAEAWVDLGILRYTVELYENGEFLGSKTGLRPRSEGIEVFLAGKRFAALVKISPDGKVRCTFSS